ncbi:MAG: D-aminoacyl-tRNA deacylase [Candidatus Micrarchaeia archaeon]
MIGIVYNELDPASKNVAEHIANSYGFVPSGASLVSEKLEGVEIIKSDVNLLEAEFVDSFGLEAAYLLSEHVSSAGVSAFTTHPTGNWGSEAKLKGKPHELSVAAPLQMLGIIQKINERLSAAPGVSLTYEATHHGPLLKTPSLFAEIGGNEAAINSKALAAILGEAIVASMQAVVEYSKVVIGIGSSHYPSGFTRLAIEKGYAFSHMFPKYAYYNEDSTNNVFMLEQAVTRSKPAPEIAILDWHSFNSMERQEIIKKLNELGIDYERL